MAMLAYCLVDARDTLPLDSPHTISDRFSLKEPSDANKQLPVGRQVRTEPTPKASQPFLLFIDIRHLLLLGSTHL